MTPHLENEISKIKHQKQNRHAMTHCQQVGGHFRVCKGDTSTVARRCDAEVESGGDQDGDDGDEQEGRVELSGGGLDGLFGKSDTSREEAPEL